MTRKRFNMMCGSAWLLLLLNLVYSLAFAPTPLLFRRSNIEKPTTRIFSQESNSDISLSSKEETVYTFVQDLYESKFPFRVIVIGDGAILESTQVLGPSMKINTSPKTGEHILTMASQDQSFEFHMKMGQVGSIAMLENAKAEKVLRIIRFFNTDGGFMSSLMLGDSSDEASKWFESLKEKHGEQIQL